MSKEKDTQEQFLKAKKKVHNIKVFYIHLVGYLIVVALLLYNLYIMAGPHKEFFFWFDIIILAAWSVFILVHGWHVFKGRIVFKKSWEERKMEEFINKEDTKRWE